MVQALSPKKLMRALLQATWFVVQVHAPRSATVGAALVQRRLRRESERTDLLPRSRDASLACLMAAHVSVPVHPPAAPVGAVVALHDWNVVG
ncbi:MAG: hypothetical protein U0235_12870 [Polyangiaceae bacterium]